MRVNHTYGRGGALAYLAACDVHRAHAFCFTEPRTGIEPFLNAQVVSPNDFSVLKQVANRLPSIRRALQQHSRSSGRSRPPT